jgi:hypothetical protein
MPTLRDVLPPVYRHLLPEVFDRPALVETRATCDDCAMCGEQDAREVENVTFLASTKCCTFHPQLPNYLVGALLEDASPELEEGRRRAREHIASGVRITPRWVAPSRKLRALYRAARHEAFGRSEELLCRYYDDGRCTIWRYRESYCSTFFCKHVAGEDGRQHWRRLRAYLDEVERILARHFAQEIAPELVEPKPIMTLEELEDAPIHPRDYARWWGAWEGREEELYREAARRLAEMTREQLDALLSKEARRRLPLVATSGDRALRAETPATLALASNVRAEPIGDGSRVRVTGYSEYDPLVLGADVFERLARVSEPTKESEVAELVGDERLFTQLCRWRVLVEPDTT